MIPGARGLDGLPDGASFATITLAATGEDDDEAP